MIWNGVKAASNQAKERIDRKLLASFGSNNRHGNPRHVDIKSSLGGGHCRIDLYEKATERSGWLLGCVTLRELLRWDQGGGPGHGHQVSHTTVAQLLADLDYSLQGTRKTLEGAAHPDRDAQFRYINRCVKVFQRAGQPVISVDAKKKELVGPFANRGRDYQPLGQPERVRTHDFPDKHRGKICPYGVYDPTHNRGWVSVGIDHDTAQCAVESIRRWWGHMGQGAYPQAHAVLITADGGGSNASRNRLWKVELQKLADEIGIAIYVRHFPPGTSKWNKIEHRMFCHITENWRGRPLISHAVVVNVIGHTTTNTGLTIQAALDKHACPTGMKVSTEDMKRLNLSPAKFHGTDWNYAIKPRPQRA